jgi:hypothetical protein
LVNLEADPIRPLSRVVTLSLVAVHFGGPKEDAYYLRAVRACALTGANKFCRASGFILFWRMLDLSCLVDMRTKLRESSLVAFAALRL